MSMKYETKAVIEGQIGILPREEDVQNNHFAELRE